jgi:hypothetical protein
MDLLIVGPPGALLNWAGEVARVVAGVGAPALVLADGGAAPAGSGPNVVVAGHLEPAHEAAVRDGRLRAVVVVDDAGSCLSALRGMGDVDAVRHLTVCAMPLGQLAGCRNVHLVVRDEPAVLAGTLLRVCGFAADGEAAFAARVPPVAAAEGVLVRQVLEPAFRFAASGVRDSVVWPRSVLLWGDHPGEPAPRILDLTGPARVLVYGPYFRLPPGRWSATVRLAFSPWCRGAPMALQMHGGAQCGGCRFRVPRAGVFEAVFGFSVGSAFEALEMRLVSERGAIEGALGIEGLVLTPVG